MYKYLNHIYNPLYTLFIIPVGLSILFILSDYLIIPKSTISTTLTQANIYDHLKGNPCKASISIPSKWGNDIFETKNVNNSICKSQYKSIDITHTNYLRRWLSLTSNNETYHLVDKAIFTDISYLFIAIISIFAALKGKLLYHFKSHKLIILAVPLASLYYFYTYFFSNFI